MSLNNEKKKIVVASKNPVKINPVREGFLSYYSSVEVEAVKVKSGVSDQPVSDIETKPGVHNRALNSRINMPNADFWVGIEGGIQH